MLTPTSLNGAVTKIPRCLLFILLILSVSWSVLYGGSRSIDLNEALSQVTGNLDSSEITTGILYDGIVPLSRIGDHDGSEMSKPASLSCWRQVYHEISNSLLADPEWPSIRTLLQQKKPAIEEGIFPIAFMNFKYNRIRRGTMEDGSLKVRDNSLVGTNSGLFIEARVFAVTALKDYTHRGGDVVFALDKSLYFTNDCNAPERIEIDFDDGRGFRTVFFGEQCRVCYKLPGGKTIRVRIFFADDTTLHGSFNFLASHLQTPNPHDTMTIEATIPYEGGFGSGEAYVYLSDSHTSLTNPIIVIEGFDLDNSKNWDELYYFLNKEGLAETLRAKGYDIVVLNYTEATDYIQRNGFVVVELIQQVNASTDPHRDIALVGASMGGLNARYALAYMETESIDHNIRIFISLDSPNRGANIPLGIQYWMDFFSDQSEEAEFMLERLDTPAARQMLVYHHTDPPGATGTCDSLRGVLLSDLADVGQYPVNLRKVAIANGSGIQADQGFTSGDQIILYEYSSFLVDIIGNVWAVSDGANSIIFDGFIDIVLLPEEEMTVSVSGTLPYDNAPGGSRPSMAQMDTTDAPYGDIVALYDSHCFIPTISALDIETADLFYDIAGDMDIMTRTPFDTIYYPVENQEHVEINAENANWLLMEVQRGVTAVDDDIGVFCCRPVLYQNFPNPFNPVTYITFELPLACHVELDIFDVLGKKIDTILDSELGSGRHTIRWDGKDCRGRSVATGIYFYRIKAGNQLASRKMVLLK